MAYRFGNAQHLGARQQQQDAFGFSDPADESFAAHGGFLAVVADGMGGLAHGDAASRAAVRGFLQCYRSKPEAEPVPQALDRAIRAANLDVTALAASLGQSGEMGTTLIAAVLRGNELYWTSSGDSAIFLLRDGEITLLNAQHVYARILDERAARGEISTEQALGDPQRDALTSHLGQQELAEIDLSLHPFFLKPGDMLLLASDGLYKTLPERDIAALASGASDVQALCESLVATVLSRQRRGQDNVTVVALAFGEPAAAYAPPAPPARDRAREALTAMATPEPAAANASSSPAPPSAPRPSLATQELAARATAEARLATLAPPRKAKLWKILAPALLFAAIVAAAAFFAWRRAPVPRPGDGDEKARGSTHFDTDHLPPSRPDSPGTEQKPVEFEPLQPGAVEQNPATPPTPPSSGRAQEKKQP